MKKNKQPLQAINIILGFLSIAIFVFIFYTLYRLRPKMLVFESLTSMEEAFLTAAGFGLLVIFGFYLFSLWQITKHVKQAQEIKPIPLISIILGVLSLLFIFSDIALLSDIHKQYRYGLSQPEWTLVFPIMAVQVVTLILFLFFHLTGRFVYNKTDQPARDINIFLILQYVGVISGLMGLGLASMGFIYSTGWNPTTHSLLGGIAILSPYGLALFYWLITKLQEKDRQWFDEKQSQDIGKSSLLTLSMITILMIILYAVNFKYLNGIISMLWLPVYLFSALLLFSLGNIYFSKKT
ncbi:MAG TPA: hypothetical protein VIM80_01035 [Brevefilum sp.]